MSEDTYVSSGKAIEVEHVAWVLSVYDDTQTKVVARVGRLTDTTWTKGQSPGRIVVGLVAQEGDLPGITVLSRRDDEESVMTYTALRPLTAAEAGRLVVAIDRVRARRVGVL